MAATDLIPILEQVRELVCAPPHAGIYGEPRRVLAEVERHLEEIRSSGATDLFELGVLFAPTGDLQEVSMDNGWGEEFLRLSAHFDRIAEQPSGGVTSHP